ncbi:hypothetical protein F4778DRAFT_591872 [Xylariomycetidae sp. FL2044]|nr:hypothetical protein F4778DRAFT_591872 [Xylariomycetidae sp. FL2044]
MAEAPRQSAFMPTVTCSSCGNQVEISMMGDHLCSGAAAAPEPPPPMPDLLGGAFSSFKQNVFDKFARAPPAVDTSAANNAFTKPGQLTPISASTGSLAISPKTPTNGRPGAGASADDYFSPAIVESPRRVGGYGGFSAEPESYEGETTYGTSPDKQPTSLLTRMNSIAPGPFEMKRKASANPSSRANSRDDGLNDGREDSLRAASPLDRPDTAMSRSSANSGGSVVPPRVPRKHGYGGFGPPRRDSDDLEPQPLSLAKRSETFPERLLKADDDNRFDAPARTPSAPGPRPDRSQRPGSNLADRPATASERSQRPSFGMRDASRPPPPRKSSMMRPLTRDGNRNLSVNLADEFGVGNPYHTPSVSQSSSGSGYSQLSQPSQPSSNTSPARSMGSRMGRRKPSDTSGFDALMDDLQTSIGAMQPKDLPPTPSAPAPLEKGDDYLKAGGRKGPPEGLRLDPAIQMGRERPVGSPIKSPSSAGSPGMFAGREDPAIQGGRSRSPPPRSAKRQQSKDQRSRGDCKACSLPITGKSISSADGRLTGRYHKACFVCTTCKEPFSSSTFYVLNDKPYCEQHYHKLNKSLCGHCNKGIEGQYLEDESATKYHPGCFRCGDCGTVLRDGYFDVNGESYCERDAWRRLQSAVQTQQQQQQQRQPSSRMQTPQPTPSVREPPAPRGLPAGPASKVGPLSRPFGLPTGNRLAPGQALRRGGLSPIPRMEKRMTRLGMM